VALVRGFASAMSEVISFRLDKENIREAKALMILQVWRTNGYSIRQAITEALVSLSWNGHKSGSSFDELNEALSQVNHLRMRLESCESPITNNKGKRNPNSDLSTSFVASVKNSAKVGLKLD
jgi:hypothetical protein